ncbi:MAG: triose-phosphate isomerase [Fimbriimonadaceae bacterium]|nr:triose-phosphate isomerase [Fimbriimonadaceae bacterium]
MRCPLVAGNWKMNLTAAEGEALVEELLHIANELFDIDVVVCPPFLSIPKIADVCRRSRVKLGAQNCFWKESGAFTGQVSVRQLIEFRVDYCIVGHSETRGRFGTLEVPEGTTGFFAESEETINLKIKTLLYHGVTPILCVGETLAERGGGITDQVIRAQLEGALKGVDPSELFGLVVAYEPVWAIGTGETCDAAEAERVCAEIRRVLGEIGEPEIADNIRILYGGSVKAGNAKELFAQPNIDGGLVGGASLNAAEFFAIIKGA